MAMTYFDSVTESTRKMTNTGRESYVPPYLRNVGGEVASFSNGDSFGFSSKSTRYGHHFDGSRPRQFGRTSRSTRGGQGRGRGGSWQWVRRTKTWESNSIRTANSEYPFDVSEKFDELEIVDDTINGSRGVDSDAYGNIPVEATGSDVPPPVNAFVEIDLGDCLNNNIHRCKFVRPTPVQQHAIPIAIAGRDLMACAQTGSGKTAAFCFPIISGVLKNCSVRPELRGSRTACPSALILAPTRELACQIHEETKKFAYQTGLKIVAVYGGAPISGQFRNMERGVDIMVATPGRLVDMIERSRVSLRLIRHLAIDEADRMLDMGFEHQIRKIVEQLDMPPPGKRQTLLFSATFPIEIQSLASDFLSNYIFLVVGRVGSSTELITQKVDFVQDMDKRNHLKNVLHIHNGGANPGKLYLTLVFVETKKGADALEYWLLINGFPAIAIHGDKVQMERERALKSFKSGATPILVATDVASRGLDIPHVSHVINFDLPKAIDDYVHRIGRTGRAGKSGLATAFFSDKNQPLAHALVELLKETNQEIPQWLAKRSTSGGQSQLHYGGDKFGGYDFRFAQSGTDNYHYLSSYGGFDSTLGSFNASCNEVSNDIANSGEYCMTANGDSYSAGTYGGGENYENVVADGWD